MKKKIFSDEMYLAINITKNINLNWATDNE